MLIDPRLFPGNTIRHRKAVRCHRGDLRSAGEASLPDKAEQMGMVPQKGALTIDLNGYKASGTTLSEVRQTRLRDIPQEPVDEVETNYEKIMTKGPNKVNPLMVPLMISNMAAGNISIQLGLKGKCTNVVTACASGTHCIGDALRAIQYGDADVMVAGGTEASVCPTGIAGFTALTALSTTNDPEHASRPFDKDRDGFVLGEGSGIVVLEELEHAKARGAKIYAELAGYGATGDAYHITSPAEDGEGAGMAMKLAMQEAGVAPEQIDYINAHGTSTHHNDLFETKAIKFALGDAAKNVSINSTKSMIGHLLGAAGGVEFVVCVKSILDGFIHQTVGTENVDPECDLDYTVGAPVEKDVNYVLTNSLGFGGHNATLLLKKYEG